MIQPGVPNACLESHRFAIVAGEAGASSAGTHEEGGIAHTACQ